MPAVTFASRCWRRAVATVCCSCISLSSRLRVGAFYFERLFHGLPCSGSLSSAPVRRHLLAQLRGRTNNMRGEPVCDPRPARGHAPDSGGMPSASPTASRRLKARSRPAVIAANGASTLNGPSVRNRKVKTFPKKTERPPYRRSPPVWHEDRQRPPRPLAARSAARTRAARHDSRRTARMISGRRRGRPAPPPVSPAAQPVNSPTPPPRAVSVAISSAIARSPVWTLRVPVDQARPELVHPVEPATRSPGRTTGRRP